MPLGFAERVVLRSDGGPPAVEPWRRGGGARAAKRAGRARARARAPVGLVPRRAPRSRRARPRRVPAHRTTDQLPLAAQRMPFLPIYK